MEPPWVVQLVKAVRDDVLVSSAAITGSRAQGGCVDAQSDLDLLLVASDLDRVSDVKSWLPDPAGILPCAGHLEHYWSVSWRGGARADIAIFGSQAPPARWVVRHYEIIKGDDAFARHLADARGRTQESARPGQSPDVCLDNLLLLLLTARARARRGELLGAQESLNMACDTWLAHRAERPGHRTNWSNARADETDETVGRPPAPRMRPRPSSPFTKVASSDEEAPPNSPPGESSCSLSSSSPLFSRLPPGPRLRLPSPRGGAGLPQPRDTASVTAEAVAARGARRRPHRVG